MLNYRDCSIEDFHAAMQQKNADPSTISDEDLYILYTKFKADARHAAYTAGSYAMGISISSKQRAEVFKQELHKRGLLR